ncbi:hypothetical protein BD769DRAFT_1387828 [Suillus cothurnatus]|nr:hypothetical protein BD769DRAFT_1387828 [Suillus cothurnatus]
MDETAYTIITTGGKLSTALEIFTRNIGADSSNYVCFGHRSIVYTRMGEWELALKDAIQSISIQKSLIGYLAKAIAHYGLKQIREANVAFDLALRFAAGDSATHHLLVLIRAIATFNTNAYDEALMYVNDMAEVSFDADLLICQVVQVYFYAEMALAASRSNTREKAIEYIDLAIQIANSCFLQTMDFSIYKEFVVIFGWNLQSLWHTVRKYKCLILFRSCNIEALDYYLSLMEETDKAQKTSLRAWFAARAVHRQMVEFQHLRVDLFQSKRKYMTRSMWGRSTPPALQDMLLDFGTADEPFVARHAIISVAEKDQSMYSMSALTRVICYVWSSVSGPSSSSPCPPTKHSQSACTALQALKTVLVPSCSLYPARYIKTVKHASNYRTGSRIAVPLSTLLQDICDGIIELRDPLYDFEDPIDEDVSAPPPFAEHVIIINCTHARTGLFSGFPKVPAPLWNSPPFLNHSSA